MVKYEKTWRNIIMRLFSKDKKKAKDELIFYIFVTACLIAGISLFVVGMIMNTNSFLVTFGVLFTITFIMFLPSIIYNIMRNSQKDE